MDDGKKIDWLWALADRLRGNSSLRSSDFFLPLLGLVFLRYVDFNSDDGNDLITEEESQARGILNLPPLARFASLVALPSYERIGESVNQAMRSIEESNTSLSGVLPKTYHKVENHILSELLTSLLKIPIEEDENFFSDIFETFLGNHARASGQMGSEFFTPNEINWLMAGLVKPRNGMTIFDPCVGMGGTLLAAKRYVAQVEGIVPRLTLLGQERIEDAWKVCKMHLAVNGVHDADIRVGNTLKHPQHIDDKGLMKFDRVIANPPYSVSAWHGGEAQDDIYCRFRYGLPPQSSADFAFIQHMIAVLKPDGVMAVAVPHGVLFRGGPEGRIRRGILEDDLIEAVIGLPAGLLPGTSIPIAIMVINKNKSVERKNKVVFINSSRACVTDDRRTLLSPEELSRIVSTFDSYADSERYSRVVGLEEIQDNSFNLNIARYVDSSPLASLVTQYDQFAKYTIRNLAVEINAVSNQGGFVQKANSVYIPISGNKQASDRLSDLESRHHKRYYQVVLDGRAINTYVSLFLGTSVGQHALSVLAQGSGIKRISKADLGECMIAMPSLDIQQEIVETHQKLTALKAAIDSLDQELSLNPTGQNELMAQVNSLLKVIGGLSDADYIKGIIRQGETKTIEFKQTFSLNSVTEMKDEKMVVSALKTIVGFLNSDGGVLLIGVKDDEKIVGINVEIDKLHKSNVDKFLLNFKNYLAEKIGEEFYPFVDHRIYEVEGLKLLVVKCDPSKSPCFLGGTDFYVRTNPATDKLEGMKLLQYLDHRFKK